jgi:hypothetical protein
MPGHLFQQNPRVLSAIAALGLCRRCPLQWKVAHLSTLGNCSGRRFLKENRELKSISKHNAYFQT